MSSVHYKFRATLEYKTLTFDGLHISVDELKHLICEKENIRIESFDLLLTNAHTKREYSPEEVVPRNSSVVVQRLPKENAQKLPKVHDTTTSGIISKMAHSASIAPAYIEQSEFSKMTEEQRLAHVKEVSYQKYLPSNYQKRSSAIMSGPPPPTYYCNRCSQPGHWYKNCPLLTQKRTTGIPMEELMETTRDDPNAMLHSSGKFVVPIMHHQARLQRKHESVPSIEASNAQLFEIQHTTALYVPTELKCGACKGLLRNAVLATCCGDSFCDECIQQMLLTDSRKCPGQDCSHQLSTDSIVPNRRMRDAVQRFVNSQSASSSPGQTDQIHQFSPTKQQSIQELKILPQISQFSSSTSIVKHPLQNSIAFTESVETANVSQAAATNASPILFPSQFTMPPPLVLSTLQEAQQQSTSSPGLQIPKFDPHMPPPPIPASRMAPASIQLPSTSTPQVLQYSASAIGSSTQNSNLPMSAVSTSSAPESTSEELSSLSSTSLSNPQTTTVVQSPAVDERNNAWASFLKRSDSLVDSSFPKNLNLTHTSHSQTSIMPSQEINDIWESFLKQKDHEKRMHQANNSSPHSSSSSSSSSRSSSSHSRITRHSRSKVIKKDGGYARSHFAPFQSLRSRGFYPVRGGFSLRRRMHGFSVKDQSPIRSSSNRHRHHENHYKSHGKDSRNASENSTKKRSSDGKTKKEKSDKRKKDKSNGSDETSQKCDELNRVPELYEHGITRGNNLHQTEFLITEKNEEDEIERIIKEANDLKRKESLPVADKKIEQIAIKQNDSLAAGPIAEVKSIQETACVGDKNYRKWIPLNQLELSIETNAVESSLPFQHIEKAETVTSEGPILPIKLQIVTKERKKHKKEKKTKEADEENRDKRSKSKDKSRLRKHSIEKENTTSSKKEEKKKEVLEKSKNKSQKDSDYSDQSNSNKHGKKSRKHSKERLLPKAKKRKHSKGKEKSDREKQKSDGDLEEKKSRKSPKKEKDEKSRKNRLSKKLFEIRRHSHNVKNELDISSIP